MFRTFGLQVKLVHNHYDMLASSKKVKASTVQHLSLLFDNINVVKPHLKYLHQRGKAACLYCKLRCLYYQGRVNMNFWTPLNQVSYP